MSYASTLARVSSLQHQTGIIDPKSPVRAATTGFATEMRTANNRFGRTPLVDSGTSDFSASVLAAASARGRARVGGAVDAAGVSPELKAMFEASAARNKVPVSLVMAVARAESSFRADAVSPAGARGMMQLMPATGAGLGVTNFFDPAQSIEGGARYLRNALRIFDGDVTKAVASYNAGVGAVQRSGGVPPYAETQNYVRKVLQYAREYGLAV